MNSNTRELSILVSAVICLLFLASPFMAGRSGGTKIGGSFWEGGLTFINQAANRLGKWMVKATNKIVGRDVASGLQTPLGYLGVLTLALLAFSAIEMARKVIWLIVVVGWALLILRIVLEVLSSPAKP